MGLKQGLQDFLRAETFQLLFHGCSLKMVKTACGLWARQQRNITGWRFTLEWPGRSQQQPNVVRTLLEGLSDSPCIP